MLAGGLLVCARPGRLLKTATPFLYRPILRLDADYSSTQPALKDKPANITKGEKRVSKFAILGEIPKEKKVKTQGQLLKLEGERKEREKRKKEIRSKQLEIQKKRDQQKRG